VTKELLPPRGVDRMSKTVDKDDEGSDGEVEAEAPAKGWRKYWNKCTKAFQKAKPEPKRQWRKEKEDDSEDDDEHGDENDDVDDDNDEDEAKIAESRQTQLQKQEEEERKEARASVPLQSLVRGFLGRVYRRKKMAEAVLAAELYAGDEILHLANRKKGMLQSRASRVGLEHFTRCYVDDLLGNTAAYIVQRTAATLIQKNWRGHRLRKRIFVAWARARRRPKKNPSPYVPVVARRVWARKEYVPEGGWPAMKWSVITYDIHEYTDSPPVGRDFGLKTRKVQLPARAQRIKDIVTGDTNAWIGIPVNVEPVAVIQRRAVQRKQELALMEGVSPFVGPQFRPVKVKPPVPLQGVEAIKALGWNSKMIDRRAPPPTGKRAYKVIDPYSNAALAADLATVTLQAKGDDDDGSSHSIGKLPRLGSSLEQRSVGSLKSFEGTSRTQQSFGSKVLGIGMRVWTGGLDNNAAIHVPGQPTNGTSFRFRTDRMEILTHETGKVVQLVTPIRGSVKPLSSKHQAALRQAKLLPEDLEEQYALEQLRAHPDAGNTRKDKERRRKRAEAAAKEIAMQDPTKWTQTVRGRLRIAASSLADEMRTQQEPLLTVDEDPWSRSTYTAKQELPSKVLVWPKQPKQSYTVKYSWLPQTMVRDAALSVYDDIRVAEEKVRREERRGGGMKTQKPVAQR